MFLGKMQCTKQPLQGCLDFISTYVTPTYMYPIPISPSSLTPARKGRLSWSPRRGEEWDQYTHCHGKTSPTEDWVCTCEVTLSLSPSLPLSLCPFSQSPSLSSILPSCLSISYQNKFNLHYKSLPYSGDTRYI